MYARPRRLLHLSPERGEHRRPSAAVLNLKKRKIACAREARQVRGKEPIEGSLAPHPILLPAAGETEHPDTRRLRASIRPKQLSSRANETTRRGLPCLLKVRRLRYGSPDGAQRTKSSGGFHVPTTDRCRRLCRVFDS